ncbi:MAG: hypothetical protein IT285_02055 [Bdellovibrionales bacterium]|nr:hypothetical protein [Bdellovibrionales bacterium]
MKTKLMTALVASVIAAPALADTVDFTDEILSRVQSVQNGQERVRVFLNRKLIVERRSDAGTDVEVNGGVDVVLEELFLRETVARGVRGKIVAIEGDLTSSYTFGACAGRQYKTVYVTFNPNCADKSCAFGFVRAHHVRQESEWVAAEGYKPICKVREVSNDGWYFLASVPANTKYTHIQTFSKKGLMKRPMSYYNNTDFIGGIYATKKNKYSIRLQVDSDELKRVIEESVNHPGVD